MYRKQVKSALVKSAPSQIGPIFVVYYCQHANLNSLNTIQQKCFVPVNVYHWYENKLNINVWLYLAMLKIINNLADKSSVSAYIWCTFPPCTLSMRRTLISFLSVGSGPASLHTEHMYSWSSVQFLYSSTVTPDPQVRCCQLWQESHSKACCLSLTSL